MASCPITALTQALTTDPGSCPEVTDRERPRLIQALEQVPDPRGRRGVRYRLATLVGVAVCAAIAGAVAYAGIADWLEDLPPDAVAALGLARRPAPTTAWRLLTRIDSIGLTRVLATWLLARTPPRGSPADGTRTHLLSAYDVATGITLAQIPLKTKGGEIAQVKPLLDNIEAVTGTMRGAVSVADALHAQTIHATDLHERGAALYVRVKANQPRLLARLRSLPGPTCPSGTAPVITPTGAARHAPARSSPSRPGWDFPTPLRPCGSPAPVTCAHAPPAKPPT